MTPDADTDPKQMSSASFRRPVRSLFGQGATEGDLAIERDILYLAGKRHRYFRFPAKQAVHVRLAQVRNVVAADRLLKFEVKLDELAGERIEFVRLRTSTAQAAQEIASALPTTRTQGFERVHNEKLENNLNGDTGDHTI